MHSVFMDGATPESTWGTDETFGEKVDEANEETLDIFDVAMENHFTVGSCINNYLIH